MGIHQLWVLQMNKASIEFSIYLSDDKYFSKRVLALRMLASVTAASASSVSEGNEGRLTVTIATYELSDPKALP